mgnify:CR=1 FL=1
MIRKVITNTYENVHFSDKYDPDAVSVMLREIDVRSSHFRRLPIVPDVRDFFTGELALSAVISTCAIGRPEIDD